MAKKSIKNNIQDSSDLIFTFKYCDIEIDYNEEMYDLHEYDKIASLINHMAKEITIDKSYVEFLENKHEKVFIKEEGWNDLCKLVVKSKIHKKAKGKELEKINQQLQIIYVLMIENYLYMILDEFDYDIENIHLQVKPSSYFMTNIEIDNIHAWKYYPGPWQTW